VSGTLEAPAAVRQDAVTVAIELSALRGRSHAAREFVEFAVAALDGSAEVEVRPWSVRRLSRASPARRSGRGTVRSRLGERAARMGLPVSSRWASTPADVIFEASGPLALRTSAPGVLTVHDLERSSDAGVRRRRHQRLQRAADEGIVLHVMTSSEADELAHDLNLSRGSIVVAAPGVRAALPEDVRPMTVVPQVVVVRGAITSRDLAVLDGLRAAGATAELADGASATPSTCCVFATADEGFPLSAFESLVAGTAVVATRTPTTTELLEGAATLVDAGSTQDFVDAAMELCTNDDARAIAVAAGRARAEDFTWAHRAPELVGVVRRSLMAL
jgi:Glycosyl transferases group 1